MPVALPSHFSGFSLPRKRSQDFGWGFAGGNLRGNGLNQGCINTVWTPIKPVLNIASASNPLKIISSTVGLIFVSVVNTFKSKGVGDESLCYEPMNKKRLCASVSSQLDLGIPIPGIIGNPDSGPDIAVSPPSVVNNSGATKYTTEITDSVEVLVSSYISPLLSRQARNGRKQFGKKLKQSLFDVKDRGFPTIGDSKVCNKISIVAGNLEYFGGDASLDSKLAMVGDFRESSNASTVGNLISRVVRDWLPNLSCQIQFSFGHIWKKLSNDSFYVETKAHSHARDNSSSINDSQKFTTRISESSIVGNGVFRGFWGRKPALVGLRRIFNHASTSTLSQNDTGFCGGSQAANYRAISMAGGASCP